MKKPKSKKPKAQKYGSFKLQPKIRVATPLPKARQILADAWWQIFAHPKLFLGISTVYALLSWVFVKSGAGSLNIEQLMRDSQEVLQGGVSKLGAGLVVLTFLASSGAANASEVSGVYQTVLFVIVSLALIWALRRTQTAKSATVKQAFYQGMYPLVPFIIVLIVIGFQLVPALIGNALFEPVINGAIGSTPAEKILFGTLFLSLMVLSLYLICSSIFALYIVTLPNMTPLKALRSARQLVLHRRLEIARKLTFLISILLIAIALIMLPIIWWLPAFAEFIFFTLTIFSLTLGHAFVYNLYRKLL